MKEQLTFVKAPWSNFFSAQVMLLWSLFLVGCGVTDGAPLRTTHHELINLLTRAPELKHLVVDYETFVDEIEEPGLDYTNAVDIASGGRQYRCYLPPAQDEKDVMTWDNDVATRLRNEARKNELTQSKLVRLLGSCVQLTGSSEGWKYNVCFGREIVTYKGTRLMTAVGRDLFHLGYHEPALDRVYLNGTMIQVYVGGTQDRYSMIRMSCSDVPQPLVHSGTVGNETQFELMAPEFCDWRPKSTQRPHIDSLLSHNLGECFNLTAEWWTYEYCHPDSLLQFHLESNGSVVTPMFLLGGLMASNTARRPMANPTFPFIRSVHPLESAELHVPRQSHLPVEIIDLPPRLLTSPQVSGFTKSLGTKGLALYMSLGSPCPEMPAGVRTTRVIFVCPYPSGASAKTLRPMWVEEVRTCQYDMLIEAPAVCAHPLLRPVVEKLPKTVPCFQRRNKLASNPDFPNIGQLALRPQIIDSIDKLIHTGDSSGLVRAANWIPSSAAAQLHHRIATGISDLVSQRVWKATSMRLSSGFSFLLDTPPTATRNTTDARRHRFVIGEPVLDTALGLKGSIKGVVSPETLPQEWLTDRSGVWKVSSHADFQRLLTNPLYVLEVKQDTVVLYGLSPDRFLQRLS